MKLVFTSVVISSYSPEFHKFFDLLFSALNRSCFLSFTIEENYWLTNKLRIIDKVFKLVPLSDDVIKEMLNLSFGVGTKDNFLLPKLLQVFTQRVWTLMSCHPEFVDLPMLQKASHFRRVGALGITLFLLKKEPTVCESMEQLQVRWGLHTLNSIWSAKYALFRFFHTQLLCKNAP